MGHVITTETCFTIYFLQGQGNIMSSLVMGKGLKSKPPVLPDSTSQSRHKSHVMAHSKYFFAYLISSLSSYTW